MKVVENLKQVEEGLQCMLVKLFAREAAWLSLRPHQRHPDPASVTQAFISLQLDGPANQPMNSRVQADVVLRRNGSVMEPTTVVTTATKLQTRVPCAVSTA